MSRPDFHLVIRTPRQLIVDQEITSMRVPTQSGQVGLRPRGEPSVLAVEPGLIVIKRDGVSSYAGTAGGLLHINPRSVSLLTPLAVTGDDVETVSSELDLLLETPSEEMEVRRTLGQLESRILQELRDSDETTES